MWEYRDLLISGAFYSILFAIATILGGMCVGLVVALGRMAPSRILRFCITAFTEVFRCTPLLVILIWFYYALPVLLGIDLSPITAAFLALSLYGGAFYGEVIRGGILAIDIGQTEAAKAIGMRNSAVMRRIILPQATRKMIPPLVNQSVMQMKNTSLISVLALPDLIYQSQLITHETYRPLEMYTAVAVIYFLILYPATFAAKKLEFKSRAGDAK